MERIICCTYSYRPFCKAKHTHLCCGSGSVLNPYSGALWIGIHTCKYRIYYSISPIRDSIEEKVFLLPLFSYRLSFKIFVLFSLKIDNITLHLDPYCAKILDPDLNSMYTVCGSSTLVLPIQALLLHSKAYTQSGSLSMLNLFSDRVVTPGEIFYSLSALQSLRLVNFVWKQTCKDKDDTGNDPGLHRCQAFCLKLDWIFIFI